jgi:hypothetical protein
MVENRWLDDPQIPDESGLLTDAQMRERLLAEVDAAGTQKTWAAAHGVSQQMLCDVLQGKRNIRGLIAASLGYQMVIRFKPIEDEE